MTKKIGKMRRRHQAWASNQVGPDMKLVSRLLLATWLVVACAACFGDDAPDYALEMSTTLTFDAQGTPPIVASPPVPVSARSIDSTTAAPATKRGYALALMCTLLGLTLGAWLARRSPVDLTPAQDRLAGELQRSRERYLGLLEQRQQRRDPQWESTVTTLRRDLAQTRSRLDEHMDRNAQLDVERHEQQVRDQNLTHNRDALANTLSEVRDELAQTRAELSQECARRKQDTAAMAQLQEQSVTLREQLAKVTTIADQADELRAHNSRLEHRLDAANAELEQTRKKTEPLTQEAREAQHSVARMLDKNLALEAELARLGERQKISEHGQAQRVAELIEQLRHAEQQQERMKTELNHKLAAATAEHLKREQDLSEKLHASAKQIEHSEQAKRRVLSLLQQEKADSSDALSELESLRVDHAHTLEQFDTVQNMLSTAEDRIDEQDKNLHELIEDNNSLSLEVAEKEDALRAMASSASSHENSQKDSQPQPSDGIEVDEALDSEMIATTIAQLTRSRDAALEEVMHLRATFESVPEQSMDENTTLGEARRTIRRLEADLRVRSDLIDALREDARDAAAAKQAVLEKDEQLAQLSNELSLALDETGRLRTMSDAAPRATPADVIRLRQRIDGLQDRLDAKDLELAILSAAANEGGDDMLKEHVNRLEADQDASVTVIRFLEGEVKKLSKELRVTAASRVG